MMSTVWDRTAEFLRDNRSALAPIVVFGLFVPLLLFGLVLPLIGAADMGAGVAFALTLLVLSLVTSWAALVITALAFDPAGGRGPAMRTANRRLLPVFGIGIVTGVALLVALLPFGVPLAFGGIDMAALAQGRTVSTDTINGGAVAVAMLYGIVLVPVLFWLYARFLVLVTPIMVMERRGLGVYARGFVLTRGIAWKVIGMVLLYTVVSWIASTAAKTVSGTVFALLFGRGEGPLTLAGVLTRIVSAGVSTVFSVLAVAFVAKLYLATRDAREAIIEAS